mgnify:CR=1 FL=1
MLDYYDFILLGLRLSSLGFEECIGRHPTPCSLPLLLSAYCSQPLPLLPLFVQSGVPTKFYRSSCSSSTSYLQVVKLLGCCHVDS